MKEKIKNYFATPLTKGWLWKWTAFSLFISACFSIGLAHAGGAFDKWLKPDDSWTEKK